MARLFVKRRAVEARQRESIFRKMRWHPIEDNAYACSMKRIHQVHEVLRTAVPAPLADLEKRERSFTGSVDKERMTGAVLDSLADICFVACCAIRLIPVVQIPTWLWIWAGVIVAIKIVNQVSALIVCNRFCFPHTTANKLTGLLLFLSVPTVFWCIVPFAFVAGVASFAAVQEGHFIRTRLS